MSCCTDDVVYQPPTPTRALPHTQLVRGKADYRAYLQQAYTRLPDFQIEQFSLFPHPTGLAVRYSTRWAAADGRSQQLAASLVFHFEGMLIRQFGVQAGDEVLVEQPVHCSR